MKLLKNFEFQEKLPVSIVVTKYIKSKSKADYTLLNYNYFIVIQQSDHDRVSSKCLWFDQIDSGKNNQRTITR